jgi:hypothetical protein
MTQKDKHEKAIKILDCIDTCTNRIFRCESDLLNYPQNDFLGWGKWQAKRLESLKLAKIKLQNYYNKNFKL